ncbi:hypothetical protein LSH36_1144g00022 [Paralvinella palmiformis]|uniref:Uncharacterized protein n=1 Tax=Paralvinella palmiformis TaxID=53620 RepID=A0AAD9MPH1_9ANNE|nr:hypothetical protein LSH36_1144g00022 [Paralvinella palmiformis]
MIVIIIIIIIIITIIELVRKLHESVEQTLYFDTDPVSQCTRRCLDQQFCISFDSYLIDDKPSCSLSTSLLPLVKSDDSIHWYFGTSCTTRSGKASSFAYVGEYALTIAGTFTSITTTDSEDCLFRCAISDICRLVSYHGNICQHSPDEFLIFTKRTRQPDWIQFIKLNSTIQNRYDNQLGK